MLITLLKFLFLSLHINHKTSIATSIKAAVPDSLLKNELDQHNILLRYYYFRKELTFLVRQSITLCGYNSANAEKSNFTDNLEADHLRLLEKSIQLELHYIRILKIKLRNSYSVKLYENQIWNSFSRTIRASTWCYTLSLYSDYKDNSNRTLLDHRTIKGKKIDIDWMREQKFVEIFNYFNCYDFAVTPEKPFYSQEMWESLWEAFQSSSLAPFPRLDLSSKPIYYVAYSSGKGRGAFASKNIWKGELIHSGYPNTIFFLDAISFYRFIGSLTNEMACDVMEWIWIQDLTGDGNVVICLNMDIAAFFNNGSEMEKNMGTNDGMSLDFYATRNILQDEEILYSYDDIDTFYAQMAELDLF